MTIGGTRSKGRDIVSFRTFSRLGWLFFLVAVGYLAVQRFAWFGDYVTGLDAGSWFAYGRQLFGQPGGKPVPGTVPPLVPLLLYLGQTLVGPMLSAKIVGLGSVAAILIATYFAACHGMMRFLALSVALTVATSGSVTETMIFGGYLQNYAIACLLVASIATVKYLNRGARSEIGLVAVAWSLVALTHHMYFAVSCLVIGVCWFVWVLRDQPPRIQLQDRTLTLAIAGGFALVSGFPTFFRLYQAGYHPPVNASNIGFLAAFQYSVRDAPWVWAPVFSMGICYTCLFRHRRMSLVGQVALALMITSLILFPITAEARLMTPFIVGACLSVGDILQSLWAESGSSVSRVVVALAALALPTAQALTSAATIPQWFDYYRVADQSLLAAAHYIDSHHGDGLVIIREDYRGWAVGWWFEGLTSAEIVTGADERWLAFPREIENARLSQRIFERGLTVCQVVSLAAQRHVDFLVFRKWDWIGWISWLEVTGSPIHVVYDDDEFMILGFGK